METNIKTKEDGFNCYCINRAFSEWSVFTAIIHQGNITHNWRKGFNLKGSDRQHYNKLIIDRAAKFLIYSAYLWITVLELFTVICLIQHLLAFLYLYNVDSTPWRYGDLFRSAASSLITSFLPSYCALFYFGWVAQNLTEGLYFFFFWQLQNWAFLSCSNIQPFYCYFANSSSGISVKWTFKNVATHSSLLEEIWLICPRKFTLGSLDSREIGSISWLNCSVLNWEKTLGRTLQHYG